MPTFDVWDVVKVPFPYTNRSVRQQRPALVIACPRSDGGPRFIWVLMITSAENRGWSGDVHISSLEEANLPIASIVRTAKMACIDERDAERLGRLPLQDRNAVASHLRAALSNTLRAGQ